MKKEEFDKLKPEIQEYIQYLLNIRLINTTNKEKILDKLSRTKIKPVTNKTFGGETKHSGNDIIVSICEDRIALESKEFVRDFQQSLGENIFHELIHASSILDDEIEQKLTTTFSNFTDENNAFPFVNTHGYTIINEYIAQSIAQRLVAEKYKDPNLFPNRHCKFTFNENGYAPEGSSFSYEYDSSLNFYGEIEEFALKFVESVYGKRDIEKLYFNHFNGNFIDVASDEFRKRKNGMENLYQMFGYMSNIIASVYYQQGYLNARYPFLSVENFKNSVNGFNRIADMEINRQFSL